MFSASILVECTGVSVLICHYVCVGQALCCSMLCIGMIEVPQVSMIVGSSI